MSTRPNTDTPSTDILRTEWGFDGYVQSDFWSCRSCAPSLNAGIDQEMPGRRVRSLEAWNQGAEDGHVVADLLFGVANPSGKVPTSYPSATTARGQPPPRGRSQAT